MAGAETHGGSEWTLIKRSTRQWYLKHRGGSAKTHIWIGSGLVGRMNARMDMQRVFHAHGAIRIQWKTTETKTRACLNRKKRRWNVDWKKVSDGRTPGFLEPVLGTWMNRNEGPFVSEMRFDCTTWQWPDGSLVGEYITITHWDYMPSPANDQTPRG